MRLRHHGGHAEAQLGAGLHRVAGEGGGWEQDVRQGQGGDAARGEREAGGLLAGREEEVEAVETCERGADLERRAEIMSGVLSLIKTT